MPDHLRLPAPTPLGSRRTASAGGPAPTRNRGSHGARLRQQLTQVVVAPRRLDAGIDPALVFKIKASRRPNGNTLENRALQILGESNDFTYFVLSEDRASTLSGELQQYTSTGALHTVMDLIDDIEPYGPIDRLGPGLRD